MTVERRGESDRQCVQARCGVAGHKQAVDVMRRLVRVFRRQVRGIRPGSPLQQRRQREGEDEDEDEERRITPRAATMKIIGKATVPSAMGNTKSNSL